MRKIVLTSALLALTAVGVQAQKFIVDGLGYSVLSDGTVKVLGFATDDDRRTNLVIPSEVEYDGKTYVVSQIGNSAFTTSYDWGVTSVTIPSSVTTIGSSAFFGSTSKFYLKELNLSEGLKTIGASAFYANGIENLVIPASVDSIGKSAFLYSPKLQTLTFQGEGLRHLGDGAFVSGVYAYDTNNSLKSVKLPASVQYIGREAFLNNRALESFNVPRDLKELGECVIGGTVVSNLTVDEGCKNFIMEDGIVYNTQKSILYLAPLKGLTKLDVPEGVLGINGGAFWDSDLQEITLPEGLVAIGYGAFENSQLRSINFPSTLVFIDEQAFAQTKFTQLELPESVPYVNDAELYGCTALSQVTIPSSVREIYNHAFTGSTALRNFVAKGSVPPEIMDYYDDWDFPFYGFGPGSTTITVPKGSKAAYEKAGYDGYMKVVESDKGTLLPTETLPESGSMLTSLTDNELSFELTFDDELTLLNAEPQVFIREEYTWNSTLMAPYKGFKASVDGKKLYISRKADDGSTSTMQAEQDGAYYVIIPSDIVKNANEETNEQIIIELLGPDEATVTGIQQLERAAVSVPAATFDLKGQRVGASHKGLTLQRHTDGSVRKVLVK